MNKENRKYFTKFRNAIKLPDLIEIQKRSYEWFFEKGLKELFEEVSPIKDFTGRDLELYFLDYRLEEPKFERAGQGPGGLPPEPGPHSSARLS